jgi:fructose-1,6-bisphosphatase/inositol monophosphatase family enzyme
MMRDRDRLLAQLRDLHEDIRAGVVRATEAQSSEALAAVDRDAADTSDTIFAIDRVGEERLVEFFERVVAPERPLVLIAEGLRDVGYGAGVLPLPRGTTADAAEIRILVDPIDGTRGLMYQKRSAWILTGVAPNNGSATRLRDIELALQTEIPLVKQHLADVLWAVRGEGIRAERVNRLSGAREPLALHPSRATDLSQGFATFCRFFPGTDGATLAEIEARVMNAALGTVRSGSAPCFEDQYICNGGQLYELIAGHDRFIADLRPLLPGFDRLCAHPYDLAAMLIAEEAGVIVTDPASGTPLDAPLDVTAPVAWAAYANDAIRALVEPALHAALTRARTS